MSTFDRYSMPSETNWKVPAAFDADFEFEYDDSRDELLSL
jgi:hypothetical protein